MAADISPLAALMPRPSFDLISAVLVMLVTGFIHVLPIIAQVLGALVMAITVWEKPTVQAVVARLRARFSRKDDNEAR